MEINNSKITTILYDYWIIGLETKPSPICLSHLSYILVSDFIIPNSTLWNIPLLQILFTIKVVNMIKNVIITPFEEDIIKWNPTKDGVFTVKSIYKKLEKSRVNSQDALNTVSKISWKALWKMNLPHRIKLFIWKCLKGIVPTRLRLYQHTNIIETHCGICRISLSSFNRLSSC